MPYPLGYNKGYGPGQGFGKRSGTSYKRDQILESVQVEKGLQSHRYYSQSVQVLG